MGTKTKSILAMPALSGTSLVAFQKSEINASSIETLSQLIDEIVERIEAHRLTPNFSQKTIDAIRTGGTIPEADFKHLLSSLDTAIWEVKFSLDLFRDMFVFMSAGFEETANEMRPLIDKEVLAIHYAKYTQAWLLGLAADHNIEMEVAA